MTTDSIHPPRPLLESLNLQTTFSKRKKKKIFPKRRDDNDDDRLDASPGKIEIGRSTIDIRQPTIEHQLALRQAFKKILNERLLSDTSLDIRREFFKNFRQTLLRVRDAKIILYGSLSFECCLEKPGMMDIDVQFKQTTSTYETLKELLQILTQTDFCKEAAMNTEHKPSCIDLIVNEPNMRVRITSGYHRGIHLSRLIRIYTKFDRRTIQLLRLFRILSKTCNVDKPDLGTLHPIVFHIMIIHFLQQVDPPVLPCLHEYAFGIDHVPVTLNENQYEEFLNICNDYSQNWQSKNTTDVEILFLQCLSYYVKTFPSKQFVVSIQTRMPVVKLDKNWHSRKLLVEDPTDIKRSLCQTMQSVRSINYFRDILTTALNYFGRKQKKIKKCLSENSTEDLIEIIHEDEDEIPIIEPNDSLHNSYRLFYKTFPLMIIRDGNIRQNRIRDFYKKFPEMKFNRALMKLDQPIENEEENIIDIDEDEQNDLLERIISDEELNFNQLNLEENPAAVRQLFPTNDDDEEEETADANHSSEIEVNDEQGEKILESLKCSSTEPIVCQSDEIPSIFTSPIKDESSSDTDQSSTDLFYDFQAENFHAEQGAPFVCTTCNGVGHLKSECPELVVPKMIDLPDIHDNWIEILSKLCHQITERCKPTEIDIENRRKILEQLQKQFEKDYPDCNLHAFGSFYNGFGFRQSDLDVCIVFKDQHEGNTDEVIHIMRKILRSMRANTDTFENVQPILHAKVPIIRSRHRRLHIEIDISLHNMLAIENTRLLKTYTDIDNRVSQLGYMIKHLAKSCDIGDASRGTLSSYAYIIMLIHFLQQIQPAVLPVLQEMCDEPTKKNAMIKKCSKWNVYFYEDLQKLNERWTKKNQLTTGALWIEFLRFYTEQFNYDEHVVTIRQTRPLLKHEKGWFRQTVAIEDPFELSHNLAGGLSIKNWTMIRRVFIRARQQFGIQAKDIDLVNPDMQMIESNLFNIDDLCPGNAPKRCPECKGPYHIRKRCPKLISLATEKDKLKRMNVPQPPPPSMMVNHHSQQQFYAVPSHNPYYYYYHPPNGYSYPFEMIPQQRIWTQPYSNESSRNSPMMNYYHPSDHSNRTFNSNNQRKKHCYGCGSVDHLRAQCPQFQRNPLQR